MSDENTQSGQTIGLVEAEAQEAARLERSKRLTIGFPKLERMVKFSTHKYIVLAARPGMYKTTLAWNWAVNLASSGHPVLWISLEMAPGIMHTLALSRYSGISRDDIEQHKADKIVPLGHQDQWRTGMERLAKVRALRFHQGDATLASVLDSMNRAPYAAVFLDYLQLVNSGAASSVENVSTISKALAWHAHTRGPMVCCLSQLNREIDRVPNTGVTSLRYPRLSDLKGSSQIEQDADAVLFLHDSATDPHRDRTKFEIVCEKNRYGRAGVTRARAYPAVGHITEEEASDG